MFALRDSGTASRGPTCHDPVKITEWSGWNEWSGCKPEELPKEPTYFHPEVESKQDDDEQDGDEQDGGEQDGDKQDDKEPDFVRIGFCKLGFQTRERSRVKDDQIEHDKQQVMCVAFQAGYAKCIHALRLMARDLFDWFNEPPMYYDLGVAYYDFYPQFEGKWPIGDKFKHEAALEGALD